MVLEGDDGGGAGGVAQQQGAVERLDEAGVDDGGRDADLIEAGGELPGHGQQRAETEDDDLASLSHDPGGADRDGLRSGLERGAGACAARVADGAGAGVELRGAEHIGELVLVGRDHVDEVGDRAQVGDVEEAVVGSAVVARKAAAIHAKDDREVLEADIVDDGVKRALEKGGVDGAKGLEAARGEAGGEDDGVFLGDADVEVAGGVVGAKEIERGAIGHGGGDGDDLRVFVGQFDEGVGEDLGVGGLAAGVSVAGFGVVGTQAVELFLPVEGGLEAAAFLSDGVEKHGAVLPLEELEGVDEQGDVVAVEGAVVGQAEVLEEGGREKDAFGGFFGALDDVFRGAAADALDQPGALGVQRGDVLVGDDFVKVAGDGADVAVDGPLVVVEHDDEAFGAVGDIVEGLESDAVGEGGVARESNDVLGAAGKVAGDGHAEGGGKGGAGVACAVAVVRAFGAKHEAVEAAGLADGVEARLAPGEELVDVGLVRDVKDEFVGGRGKDVVEGKGELNDTEIGAEVAAGAGKGDDEAVADLLGEGFKLGDGELLEVRRGLDGAKSSRHALPWARGQVDGNDAGPIPSERSV